MTLLWCLWAFSRRRAIRKHNQRLRARQAELTGAMTALMGGISLLGASNSHLLVQTLGYVLEEQREVVRRLQHTTL